MKNNYTGCCEGENIGDISEKERAEKGETETRQEFHLEEKLCSPDWTADSSVTGLITMDFDGNLRYVNPFFYQNVGIRQSRRASGQAYF